MPSPATVSLQIPYVENEREFVMLAVQIAVRTFRSMSAGSGTSTDSSNSGLQTQEALNERQG